jgi:catechol 2,3-dioxygenase-like lactoylglutathione lyase family enzyme
MSGFTETVVTRTEEQRKHNFSWQQTMLRIKDPKITVPFYENNFGFRLLHKYDFPQWSFSLYFLYIPSDGGELFHIQNKPLMIANRKAARAWNRSI